MSARDTEFAVIGGGLVGMAIATGLAWRGRTVSVFDEGDQAFRASRGNFGLVWVQSKGVELPDYARWSRLSASLWPQFASDLAATTGIELELAQPGGLEMFLTDTEAQQAVARLGRLRDALDGDYPFEYLGHNALKKMVPEIGHDVVGATYSPMDGHVNPLYLLRALYAAFNAAGGHLVNGAAVERIEPKSDGFRIFANGQATAGNVVLCAGLGNARLAPMVGLKAPVKPLRGQVLICERVKPFLNYPTVHVRQVGEGAVQIGDSHEDVGFNDATTPEVISRIAHRAVRLFPILQTVRMVRAWGALRIMTPDGHPIYDRSLTHPGASLVTCHSGVTLAAVHANVLAGWIAGDDQPELVESLSAGRFNVRQVA